MELPEFDRTNQRQKMHARLIAIALAGCAALTGCGESAKPEKSGIIVVQPPAPSLPATKPATPSRAAEKSDSVAASRTKRDRSRNPSRFGDLSLLDDPRESGESFVASEFDPTADHERWEVSEPERQANEADLFAVVIPERGVDSSQFAVADRPKSPTSSVERNSDFTVPSGFAVVDEAGWSPEGYPWRIRCEKDGSIMVLVPAGTFLQGANAGSADSAPEHAVELDAFYIDQAEVTNGQYEDFRVAVRDLKRVAAPARSTSNLREPVMGITWADAIAYAHWAGKELPTEAQWEKAGRGPNGFVFPWGNGRPLWQRSRQPGQIDTVMSFAGDSSPFGAFDLAGNAREWCADWYSDSTYKQIVAGGTIPKNPIGPKNPAAQRQRVVKGGATAWGLWSRAGVGQGERPQDVGFRCVWAPKSAPVSTSNEEKGGSEKKSDGSTKSKSGGF